MNDQNSAFNDWEKLLNPEKLKNNLIKSSIYLAAYELFKNDVIEKLRGFFTSSWTINEKTGELEGKPSDSYKEKVLSLYPKDEFQACCIWFKNLEAFVDDDLMDIAVIRKHRNMIAHELPKFIATESIQVNHDNLARLLSLQQKLDKWWIKEIEVPTNPDFDSESYESIDWDNVFGGNTLFMNLLTSIFDGDDTFLKELHQKFIELWRKTV